MLRTRAGGRGVGSLDISGYSIDVGVGVEVKVAASGLECCVAPSMLGAYRSKSRFRKFLLLFGGTEAVGEAVVVVVVAKKSAVNDRCAPDDLLEFGLLPFPFKSRSSVCLFVGSAGLDGRVEKGEAKKAWVFDCELLAGAVEHGEGDIEGDGTDDRDNGSRSV